LGRDDSHRKGETQSDERAPDHGSNQPAFWVGEVLAHALIPFLEEIAVRPEDADSVGPGLQAILFSCRDDIRGYDAGWHIL
jgi:hypothetical protein